MARVQFAGDDDRGAEGMLDLVGDALAPEGDEGGEDWGLPNVVAYIEARLAEHLALGCEVPPRGQVSPGHMRGAAGLLRDLVDAIDDRADEMSREA